MNEANKATILRSFVAREAELSETAGGGNSWNWVEGSILFPEALCPYCQSTMRSNCIWKVRDGILLGQVKFEGGRRVEEPERHPHSNVGNICMGEGDDPIAALFLWMSPDTSYWGGSTNAAHTASQDIRQRNEQWRQWMADVFDHNCQWFVENAVDHKGEAAPPSCQCADCRISRGEVQRCVHCSATYGSTETHTNCPVCPCGCFCRPERGSCECGCDACRCDDEPEGIWCGWCEETDDTEHDHDLRTCKGCGIRFEHTEDTCYCCTNCEDDACSEDCMLKCCRRMTRSKKV